MAKHPLSKRDEHYQTTRRALIKWSVAAGAALGVSRSKIFEILEGTAGKGVAEAASSNPANRFIGVSLGNGALAWATLLWPYPAVGLATNPGNLSYQSFGQAALVPGTFKPLVRGPDTPWEKVPAARQMSVFMNGRNETHTRTPQSSTTLGNANIFAVNSALQAGNSAVIPFIAVGGVTTGTAPGAAAVTSVGEGRDVANLFNSAASQATGVLANANDASLYKAQADAFFQLNRAANRATTRTSYNTASSAAGLLGTNLADQLTITPADLARYGIDNNTRGNVAELGRTFIIAVKAFKLGLTNSVVLSALNDDPHNAFADNSFRTVPPMLKKVFDGLMDDLTVNTDESNVALADSTVIALVGDTPKSALNKNGWGDGSEDGHNLTYVYSAGNIRSGWFGSLDLQGNVQGFNTQGAPVAYNAANTARITTAAIAFAVAKRDARAVAPFSNNLDLGAIVNPADT